MEISIWDGKGDVLISLLFVLQLFPSYSTLGHLEGACGKAKSSATLPKSINNIVRSYVLRVPFQTNVLFN